jgi:N-acetyl-gamma-glutamyl-phosphate reductase
MSEVRRLRVAVFGASGYVGGELVRLLAEHPNVELGYGCLASAYADAPFVRVLPPGGMADTKRTRGSNLVELQAVADRRTGTAVVAGALDNLVKGAAGQAVQNMNLMAAFDPTAGLTATAVYP